MVLTPFVLLVEKGFILIQIPIFANNVMKLSVLPVKINQTTVYYHVIILVKLVVLMLCV